MPEKQRGIHRHRAAIASGFLLLAVSFRVECYITARKPETAPPVRHTLADIALRVGEPPAAFTPTAVVAPERGLPKDRIDDTAGGEKEVPAASPSTPQQAPDKTATEPPDVSPAPLGHGAFTIRIGAYIIHENLSLEKSKIVSLGFTPHTTTPRRMMKMSCIVVAEGIAGTEAGKDRIDPPGTRRGRARCDARR